MLVIVFLVTAAVMAAFNLVVDQFLGEAMPWPIYGWSTALAAIMATVMAFFTRRRAVQALTLDANPHAVALVLKAVNHIVGNLMNQFQFVRQQIESEGALSDETAGLIDSALDEGQHGLAVLNDVQDTDDEASYSSIYPK